MRRLNVIVRLVSDDTAVPSRALRQVIAGSLTHLRAILNEFKPHRIIVALAERRGCLGVADLVYQRVRGVIVEDAIDAYERLAGQLAIESMLPSGLAFGSGFAARPLYVAVARVCSAVAAVVTLVVVSPLLGLIAVFIKLDSPGPVFFLHERLGRYGKPFKLIKFRTMRDAPGGPSEWVRDNFRRITRVGRWLRLFRLDEVPQLVNVLRGDMNLVGPRPHPVSNYELFNASIPYYSLRSVVKPGITGWAQVLYGYANSLEEEAEKMRYDLYYIKHQSPALDLRILLDTVKVILGRQGASATLRREGALDDDRPDARHARYTHHNVS
jgi:lipopolysaccharide/colanic/teichoic acid biosynthesis glycosyltransferase